MLKRLPAFAILLSVAAFFALCAVAQQDEMRLPGAVYDFDKKNEKPNTGSQARYLRSLGTGRGV